VSQIYMVLVPTPADVGSWRQRKVWPSWRP